jgi:hypothetical protein
MTKRNDLSRQHVPRHRLRNAVRHWLCLRRQCRRQAQPRQPHIVSSCLLQTEGRVAGNTTCRFAMRWGRWSLAKSSRADRQSSLLTTKPETAVHGRENIEGLAPEICHVELCQTLSSRDARSAYSSAACICDATQKSPRTTRKLKCL